MTLRLRFASFVTVCVLAACSSKAVDNPDDTSSETNDQNLDSAGNNGSGTSGNNGSTPGNSGNGDTPASSDPNTPVSDNGNPGGGTTDPPAKCADGSTGNAGTGRPCNATYKGLCFETDADACACAGCELDQCFIAESFPTQVGCMTSNDPCAEGFDRDAANETRRCDFVVNGSCFESGDDACACAGCAPDACLILESYPAQARCQ